MDLNILSTLIQVIKPKEVYTYEFFEGKKETKSGLEWRQTFLVYRKQITTPDGKKLIEHFSNPIKEAAKPQKESQHESPIKN